MFKKKRGLFSDITEVSKICATCKYSSLLCSTDDMMCSKYGVVNQNHSCKKYDYNRLLKRPPRKRQLNTKRFTAEDFSID